MHVVIVACISYPLQTSLSPRSILALSVRDFNHKSRFVWQLLRCLYVLQLSQSKGCEQLKTCQCLSSQTPNIRFDGRAVYRVFCASPQLAENCRSCSLQTCMLESTRVRTSTRRQHLPVSCPPRARLPAANFYLTHPFRTQSLNDVLCYQTAHA